MIKIIVTAVLSIAVLIGVKEFSKEPLLINNHHHNTEARLAAPDMDASQDVLKTQHYMTDEEAEKYSWYCGIGAASGVWLVFAVFAALTGKRHDVSNHQTQ